jgi:hypothetical protein
VKHSRLEYCLTKQDPSSIGKAFYSRLRNQSGYGKSTMMGLIGDLQLKRFMKSFHQTKLPTLVQDSDFALLS